MTDLEKLDPHQRNDRIRQYNDILVELSCADAKGGAKRALCRQFALSVGSLPSLEPLGAVLNAAGAAADVIGSVPSMRKREQIKAIHRQLAAAGLEADSGHEENIYILDKISKVAELR